MILPLMAVYNLFLCLHLVTCSDLLFSSGDLPFNLPSLSHVKILFRLLLTVQSDGHLVREAWVTANLQSLIHISL